MSATTPPVRISGPGDLLAIVPYLIGHEAAESLVITGISGHRVQFTARADIGAPVYEVAEHVRMAIARMPRDMDLVLIGYSGAGSESEVRRLSDALSWHQVTSVLRVTNGRFYCLSCDGCTPPGGMPIDSATLATAKLVLQGVAPLPSRRAVEEMVAPVDRNRLSEMLQAFHRATGRMGRKRFRIREARAAFGNAVGLAKQGVPLPDDDAAWLCLALHDLTVRDIAWCATDIEQWQFDLWLDLTRRCLPAAVAPVASLLAWCAWRRGDGAVAAAALNRALAVEPHYRLANMIATAMEHAMSPHAIGNWPPDDADLQRL